MKKHKAFLEFPILSSGGGIKTYIYPYEPNNDLTINKSEKVFESSSALKILFLFYKIKKFKLSHNR